MSNPIKNEYQPYNFPVSIKGVVFQGDRVVLLKNERDEWELPGGKLELEESPEACVVREIEEELGLTVEVGTIVNSWVYHIFEGRVVFVVTYGCYAKPNSKISRSPEHKAVDKFGIDEVKDLKMPEGYKDAIETWWNLINASSRDYED
jgi:8-oxo-dGTP pyrophosphatase MutT (NUDIX family)